MTSSPELAAALLRPEIEALANRLRRRTPHLNAVLQEASSPNYPWSALLTILEPDNDNPLVIEVSLHSGRELETLAADVIHEDGTIVSPSLVRRIPPRASEFERHQAIRQFVDALRVALPQLIEQVIPEARDVMMAKSETPTMWRESEGLTREARWLFEGRAQDAMSGIVGVSLHPKRLSVGSSREVSFALVSDDGKIVGDLKVDTSGRLSVATITDLVWKLQRVPEAGRRFLLIGPERASLDRWVERYGVESARPVELWALTNAHPQQVD